MSDWKQRFEVGDVVADPSGSWTPGTAEQYIDQQVAVLNTNINNEILARQTTDQSLQNQINSEVTTRANVDNTKADKATTLAGYGITNAYTKTEVNDLVDTPHQNYVTVQTYSALPATGSADTIYRVSNYDGSVPEVNVTKYSEYAWQGTQYIFLCVKSQIDEVFDITVYHSNTTYSDLAAALGTDGANVPPTLRRGGMSVKYVQTSDNKYVQYRLMATSFSTTPSDWQGIDTEITKDNKNSITSGGVFEKTCLYVPGEEIVGTLIEGITPRQSNNTIISGRNLIYYPVLKGVTYLLKGNYMTIINANNCGIAFTENIPEVGMRTTTVIEINTPIKYYNEIYTPTKNGYISISTDSSYKNDLKVYVAKVQDKADYYRGIEKNGEVEDSYNNIYTGEPIVLPRILKNKCRIDMLCTINQTGFSPQGADIYDGVYYQFYYKSNTPSDYIGFNVKNNPPAAGAAIPLTLPEPYEKAHCGNIRFRRNPVNGNALPLVWICNLGVDGDYGWCALLIDLNTSPMTIKKYFNFTASIPFDEQGNPIEQPRMVNQGMICIDPDGGRGWGISRSSNYVDPITVVPFTFDDSLEGDITGTIVQREPYQVKSLNCSLQDFFYAEDKVYIAAGNYTKNDITAKVAVLDTIRKELVTVIETGIPYEGQGISIYDGNIYFSTMRSGGNNLYKITF